MVKKMECVVRVFCCEGELVVELHVRARGCDLEKVGINIIYIPWGRVGWVSFWIMVVLSGRFRREYLLLLRAS
jgi:hypothetical protein